MGKGAIVIGLAAIILGLSVSMKIMPNFVVSLIGVVCGGIAYYLVYTFVIWLGLDTDLLKMLSALVVATFLAVPYLKKRPNALYALQMGSLLFSVPIEYEKKMREYTKKGVERKFPYCDYEFIPKTPWNYGYADANFEVKFNEIGDIPFSQENPPITIKANMQQINDNKIITDIIKPIHC